MGCEAVEVSSMKVLVVGLATTASLGRGSSVNV
jgi:hypothetical protein